VRTIRAAAPEARLETLQGDLSLMAEVRRVAAAFHARRDRLDILVNNAGAVFDIRQETSEGLEMTFALNHMSYFLLTYLLLDTLKAAPAGRIVSVASAAHRQGRVDFDDLQSKHGYLHMRAYGTSKLMNILFTRALAQRLQGTSVTANCLHPGFVASSFGDATQGFFKFVVGLSKRLFAIDAEAGAVTSVFLASDPSVAQTTGEYFVKCRVQPGNARSRDLDAAARLWTESVRLAGL
jgi:retinol dehydrogenase-12